MFSQGGVNRGAYPRFRFVKNGYACPGEAYGAGSSSGFGYPAFIYDGTGRFVYLTLKKVF